MVTDDENVSPGSFQGFTLTEVPDDFAANPPIVGGWWASQSGGVSIPVAFVKDTWNEIDIAGALTSFPFNWTTDGRIVMAMALAGSMNSFEGEDDDSWSDWTYNYDEYGIQHLTFGDLIITFNHPGIEDIVFTPYKEFPVL